MNRALLRGGLVVPYRNWGERLSSVSADCRHLPEEQKAITRELLMRAELVGYACVGELLDGLESLSTKRYDEIMADVRDEVAEEAERHEREQADVAIGMTGLRHWPPIDHELPEHLRGAGLGVVI